MRRHRQFLSFAAVGAAGFVVDASTLWLALAGGAGPLMGRVSSYLTAATFTWACNRIYTFLDATPNLALQWLRFLAANAVGGSVNYAVYAALVLRVGFFGVHPTLAVAAGSLSAPMLNFVLSSKYVFRQSPRLEKLGL